MAQPNDVKSILELGGGGHSNADGLARKKDGSKLKDKKKRPEKVNREVYALIGDVPQLAPVEPAATQSLAALVKKERSFKKNVDKWVWHGFGNPARNDALVLHHWTKQQETEEPYMFARFNKRVEVIRYTDEEYKQIDGILGLRACGTAVGTDWSRAETDHLFELCEQFSLRFIVIADRFGMNPNLGESLKKRDIKAHEKKQAFHERTVDELKDRYYSVAKAVLELRGQNDHPIVKKPFSYEQEVKRKVNNEKLFMRTKEQHEKEKVILGELKKMDQRIKKEEKDEKNFRKLIYQDQAFSIPPQVSQIPGLNEGAEENTGGRRDRGSGVFLRSQVLLAQLPTKKESLQKKFEVILEGIDLNPQYLVPTQQVTELYQELTQEILKLFALENYIKKLEEDANTINEAKNEKKTYLEAGRLQLQAIRDQFNNAADYNMAQMQKEKMNAAQAATSQSAAPQQQDMGPPGGAANAQNVPQNIQATQQAPAQQAAQQNAPPKKKGPVPQATVAAASAVPTSVPLQQAPVGRGGGAAGKLATGRERRTKLI